MLPLVFSIWVIGQNSLTIGWLPGQFWSLKFDLTTLVNMSKMATYLWMEVENRILPLWGPEQWKVTVGAEMS